MKRGVANGLMAASLVILPLLAYASLRHAGFVWDDDTTLIANPLIRAPDGLRRIWLTAESPDYWPVTYTSFWVEWRVWGQAALGYHLTNVLLHIASGLLFWRLLARLRIPGAFAAALLFVLHPLNVESVAWIAQRKNLLAMLFSLLALRAFAESAILDRPPRTDRWYVLAWLGFLLALLSKGSAIPLALVFIGWAGWKRGLSRNDAPWSAAFVLTAAVLAGVNVWFSHKSGGEVIRIVGGPERLQEAAMTVWFYLAKAVLPFGLAFVYPVWRLWPTVAADWIPLAAAGVLTFWLWRHRRSGAGPEFLAWTYFCAMLLPVMGFADVYFMRYSLVADHYVHLALLGFAAWAGARCAGAGSTAFLVAAALVGGVLTCLRTSIYRDNRTLFTSVLARNPGCWMAHNNLGIVLQTSGDGARAEAEYREALALNPEYADAHNDLGVMLQVTGRPREAAEHYRSAVRLDARRAEYHNNYSSDLLVLGDARDASAQAEQAVALQPGYFGAENNWALALWELGRRPEAVAHFERALQIQPENENVRQELQSARALMAGRATP